MDDQKEKLRNHISKHLGVWFTAKCVWNSVESTFTYTKVEPYDDGIKINLTLFKIGDDEGPFTKEYLDNHTKYVTWYNSREVYDMYRECVIIPHLERELRIYGYKSEDIKLRIKKVTNRQK